MHISPLPAYSPYLVPYIAKITNRLDSQMAVAQQSIESLHQSSASYDVKISAYGLIQSDLTTLESAAQSLSGSDAFSLYSVKSTGSTILAAFAQKNASPGIYNVEVSQLAQGETLVSTMQQSPSAVIGSGAFVTATFQFENGTRQNITIDGSNNTLQGIAASINRADFGIHALVASNGSGFQLVLNGPTGSSNAFNIGVSGDKVIGQLLSYSNGATSNAMTQTMAAQDSRGSVDGVPFTSSGNMVMGAAEGLTLNLRGIGRAAITVSVDLAQVTAAVQSFIDAYNNALSDLATNLAGDLSGDKTLTSISNQIASDTSTYGPLGQIGITRNQDGTLVFDIQAFQDAYSRNPAGVARIFTGQGNGIADQISAQIRDVIQPGGNISAKINQLLSRIQGNQQMESRIQDSAIQGLQYSAHQYALQLAMLIVTQIVAQFMRSLPNQSPVGVSAMPLAGNLSGT